MTIATSVNVRLLMMSQLHIRSGLGLESTNQITYYMHYYQQTYPFHESLCGSSADSIGKW
jgi:hypothetical protein